jgi:hypothetical protein
MFENGLGIANLIQPLANENNQIEDCSLFL